MTIIDLDYKLSLMTLSFWLTGILLYIHTYMHAHIHVHLLLFLLSTTLYMRIKLGHVFFQCDNKTACVDYQTLIMHQLSVTTGGSKAGSHGQAPTLRFRKNSSQLGRPQDTSYHLYDIHADFAGTMN